MSIKQKDIKLLWGRAGNRCSICGCKLTADSKASSSFVIGEQAHIVGEKESAPRGISSLSLEERNSYHNLILLCPTCHTCIDTNIEDYPVEKLYLLKSEHELRIEESISKIKDSKENAEDIVYSYLIDTVVELCDLENWDYWISSMTSTTMLLDDSTANGLDTFLQKIFKMIFPESLPELNRAIRTLYSTFYDLLTEYYKHARYEKGSYIAHRFYRNNGQFNPRYHEDLDEYNKWEKNVTLLAFEATKAANWFAEVVRKEINPLFFATNGKFSIIQGPNMELSYVTYIPEYSAEEKKLLPDSYSKENILEKL